MSTRQSPMQKSGTIVLLFRSRFDPFHRFFRLDEMLFDLGGLIEKRLVEFFVFLMSFEHGLVVTDPPCIGENVTPGQLEEIVQFLDPVPHCHYNALDGLKFGEFQVERHDPVQDIEFLRRHPP